MEPWSGMAILRTPLLILILMFWTISSWGTISIPELFPKNCEHKKNFLFLNSKQKKKLNIDSSIIRRFSLNCSGVKSVYFILNDKIRTHYQTAVIHIENNKISRLEIIDFGEPKQYMAPNIWVDKMLKTELDKVDALSGATLTRQSLVNMRRLAIYLSNEFN